MEAECHSQKDVEGNKVRTALGTLRELLEEECPRGLSQRVFCREPHPERIRSPLPLPLGCRFWGNLPVLEINRETWLKRLTSFRSFVLNSEWNQEDWSWEKDVF